LGEWIESIPPLLCGLRGPSAKALEKTQGRSGLPTDIASEESLPQRWVNKVLWDWRVVLALDRAEQEAGSDYYLVRLSEPYGPGDFGPTANKRLPHTFPGNVKVTDVITPAGSVVDDQGAGYWIPPWE
jgi:hypothetical protein